MKEASESSANKFFSREQSLQKIYRFCAYQERSHLEVKNKLYSFGLSTNDVDDLLTQMIVEGFLNEERFAKAFAGGKFRMQKWGRNKIVHAMEAKGLTKNCIRQGLKEIEPPEYQKALKEIIKKKSAQISEPNRFKKRDRIARFAIAKGYEPELVWEVVKSVVPD